MYILNDYKMTCEATTGGKVGSITVSSEGFCSTQAIYMNDTFAHNCTSVDIIWQDRMKNLKSARRKIISPLLPQGLTIKAHSERVTTGCMQDRFGVAPSCQYLIVTHPPPPFPLKKEDKLKYET